MKLLSSYGMDLLKLKAELLCYGVRPNKEATWFNPYFNESGYIHGTPIILENTIIVNVAVKEHFVQMYSPFSLKHDNYKHTFILYKDGKPIALCNPVKLPFDITPEIKEMLDFLRPHSKKTLFYTPTKECVYSKLGKKCLFCTFDGVNCDHISIKKFIKMFIENGEYEDITIGGATPNLTDSGIHYFSHVAKLIKEVSNLSISIEIVPPPDVRMIDKLYEVGVDSSIMSLEIFDTELRKYFCPGKSTVSIKKYIDSWKYALKLFGENNVSSVLLVGLEDVKNTIKAAKLMIDIGIIPTLIPFKPYDNCALNFLPPTSPKDYLKVSLTIGNLLKEKALSPVLQKGCTGCGGCSLEKEIAKDVRGGFAYGIS